MRPRMLSSVLLVACHVLPALAAHGGNPSMFPLFEVHNGGWADSATDVNQCSADDAASAPEPHCQISSEPVMMPRAPDDSAHHARERISSSSAAVP